MRRDRPKLARQVEPGLQKVCRHDVHSLQREQTSKHQSYRPLAGDEHRIATQQGEPLHGLEDGVNRLQHRTLEK